MPDFLFTQFAQQNIKPGTDIVHTTGRSTMGIAAGSYVADGLANAALYNAHPRFVGQSSNGRYFRALPADGQLSVDLGGAAGDGIANDQPAIQAAVNYAEAVGIGTIVFSASEYRLFCPVRTSEPAGAQSEHFYDGLPIVISTPLILKSIRHGGSRLVFRSTDGSERGANYQLVNSPSTGLPTVWRGGGIFLKCPMTPPARYADRPALTLQDLTLDGGIERSSYFGWPARPSDGDGWDITDKGIWVEGDRFSGDIRLIRSVVTGFRGELVYQAGAGNGELYIRSSQLANTNGNLFQACGTNLDIDGLVGFNGFQAYEGWSGRRGRIVNAVFEDCMQTGGLSGGRFSLGPFNNIPTRMDDGEVPWLSLDAEFRNCGPVRLGSWVRGRVKLTDSYLQFDGNYIYREGLHDVDLDVIAQADKVDGQTPVVLMGSSTPGKQTLSDIRIRLSCWRSRSARAAGRVHTQPVSYFGSIGTNVIVEFSSGEARRNSGPAGNPLNDVTDNLPCFRQNRWARTANDWAGTSHDVAAGPQIVPRGDFMAVFAPTPGSWPASLPTTGIGHGHELTMRNISAPGTFIVIAASGGGASLPARRTIAPGERISLRFDSEIGLWLETSAPSPLRNVSALATAAIPSGGVSPEQSVACIGAAQGMAATAVPSIDLGADFEVIGVRAVADAVRFRLRNHGMTQAAPTVASWAVSAFYAS